MPRCKPIRIDHRGICAGDMDRRIKIKSQEIAVPTTTVDFGENFQDTKTVWAGVKSTKGRDTFYVTNLDAEVSHVFYFRYYPGLTSESWIEYKAENYEILLLENLDERDEFYVAYCNVRGNKDEEPNFA